MGTVYLIHFSEKICHAQHYIGYTDLDVNVRLDRHKRGDGSRLLRHAKLLGIEFGVVRTWENTDKNFERKLKNRKEAPRLCPVCQKKKGKKARK